MIMSSLTTVLKSACLQHVEAVGEYLKFLIRHCDKRKYNDRCLS